MKDIALNATGKLGEKFTGNCGISELILHPMTKNGSIKGVQFTLSPELMRSFVQSGILSSSFNMLKWEEPLEGKADLGLINGQLKAKLTLKDGYYLIGESAWDLKNIILNYQSDLFELTCKAAHQKIPYIVNLNLDLKSEPRGTFTVKEKIENPGLKAVFHVSKQNGMVWESLQGTLCGLDVNFVNNPNIHADEFKVLSGNVKIDVSNLSILFSKETEKLKSLKIGQGYELAGNILIGKEGFHQLHFSGNLKGHNFDLMGYRFQWMEAKAEINSKRALIENLSIEDEAGFLTIKQMKLNKNEIDDVWKVEVPLVQVEDLRPSAVIKPGEVQKIIKPLIVKHLSLSNLHGFLNDSSSFTARGRLDFINAFKKEFNLFELPLEMIKNIGLDPGVIHSGLWRN